MTARIDRRRFLAGGALVASAWLAAPARGQSERARPAVPHGVQSGDVGREAAVVWSAADRPARMIVEWATVDTFAGARRVVGPAALPETGLTAQAILTGLPPGQEIFYRVTFQDLADLTATSAPATGRLRTAPTGAGDVTFAWSGDTVGQGWGINPDWGGLKIYETMRRLEPDFFVHSGDLIYADGPLAERVPLPGGGEWRNLVVPAKARVAQTLEEFRGNYRYTLMDEHVRRFNARVAQYVQWDDHEVTDNWFVERVLDDPRYTERHVALLAARARRALAEFAPLRPHPVEAERVYRAVRRGPLLDLFLLDMRRYRGPNGNNRQAELTDAARILGRAQARWLERALQASTATWKVIAAPQPLGLVVHHDFRTRSGSDAVAQGDGPPLGRELEIARLLRFVKQQRIRNVVWITADVHYCATHRYDPARARVTDFAPFHEFVSGPLHAGAFGPVPLDDTFGPTVLFSKHPSRPNAPPTEGYLFFGHVRIDARTRAMTVTHRDVTGAVLHRTELAPEP